MRNTTTEVQSEEGLKKNGILYQRLKSKPESFRLLTNFTPEEFLLLFFSFEEHIGDHGRRGPPPSIGWMDSFLVLLIFYTTHEDLLKLSSLLDIKSTTLRSTIFRSRPILNAALREKWWEDPIRPVPLEDTNFPFVGGLVDSTSFEVYRPKTHFNEAKFYFDAKNWMYALKKEVVVTAAPPHYAIFSQPSQLGSVHDLKIFKSTFHSYQTYLTKTVSEQSHLLHDASPSWALLGDLGYIGAQAETGIRVLTPPKGTILSSQQIKQRRELNAIRVLIEQFFGRMKRLWGICRGIYTLDHSHFDMDINNCILLTNEHIRTYQLTVEDRNLFFALLQKKIDEREAKLHKRNRQIHNYQQRKKCRLGAIPSDPTTLTLAKPADRKSVV